MSGLLHLVWAKAHGAARILATDVHPFRLEAARRIGAVAIDASTDVPNAIRDANESRGADLVIVCTAAEPAAAQALASVDRGGTILFFALYPPNTTLTIDPHRLGRDGVTILHSYAGPPADMKVALEAIAAGRVDVNALITHRLPLAETVRGFQLVARAGDSLKVIIEPQK
jgi:L-iditol 2-dehydrogenase